MGKSPISMAMFHSYVAVYQRVICVLLLTLNSYMRRLPGSKMIQVPAVLAIYQLQVRKTPFMEGIIPFITSL